MKNYLIQINNNSVEFKKESKLPQDDFNQANFELVEYTDKKDENQIFINLKIKNMVNGSMIKLNIAINR